MTMATAPFTAWPQDGLRLPAPVPAPQLTVVPASLSALEWSVVALSEQDSLASLREPGRFLSALSSLFGLNRPNRLANPRLEALRRMAVLVWHHRWNVPKSELRDFLAEGFSIDHYELVQASIAKARVARTRRPAR
jgi:hypothetical protein